MRKIHAFALLLTLASSTSFAAAKEKFVRPYGMAGCGLGSLIIGKSGGQIFAATTNYTYYNQLFAITTGTSNCVDNPNDEVATRMDRFVVSNKVAMASDIARGSGETISSISKLMGCQSSGNVATALQRNFREIFPHAKISPNEVTDSIISVIKEDDSLSQSCKGIS